MHRGDINQGISTGVVVLTNADPEAVITLDVDVHPGDRRPIVQLTPYGGETEPYRDINAFAHSMELASGVWKMRITSSTAYHFPSEGSTISYIIISRIEPKHIVDHEEC